MKNTESNLKESEFSGVILKKADNWNAMKIFSEYIKRRELPNYIMN